jgi:hypothetical protein
MNRGRVGGERRGKETDRCPLTIIYRGHLTTLHLLSYHLVKVAACPDLK